MLENLKRVGFIQWFESLPTQFILHNQVNSLRRNCIREQPKISQWKNISCLLLNSKFDYRGKVSSPLTRPLSQMNQFQTFVSHIKTHYNFIFLCITTSSKLLLPLRLSGWIFVSIYRPPIRTTCAVNHFWICCPNNISWKIQNVLSLISSFLKLSFIPPRSRYTFQQLILKYV
jgi:hypothetical protein